LITIANQNQSLINLISENCIIIQYNLYFRGFKDRYSSVYWIMAGIQNIKIDNDTIINFIIDTGSTQTIISVKDAIKLKLVAFKKDTLELINIHNLEVGKIQTSNGSMDLLKLDNITVTFYLTGDCYFVETFESIFVAKPMIRNKEDYEVIINLPSVLGIDILRNYKIQFMGNEVLLER
jgi:hypothetical protein